ncbi:MAG: response regulator [Myxococcales bacterium]|nr:MAG: response regulator [Myxococcales bacterium]
MTDASIILVAEDNEKLQALVKRSLERHGYIVVQAFNGAQMRAELARVKPDLIVLDLGLPDADGRDVLSGLKKDPKTLNIPVLIWSGRDAGSERRIALELGAEDFIEKGSASELASRIERILLRLSERFPLP